MELLNESEIKQVLKDHKYDKLLEWKLENYSDKLIGYLGEHLRLIVKVLNNETIEELRFFVKCLPLNDPWKNKLLKETGFFMKEFVMLSDLFPKFGNNEGKTKWRPKDLLLKPELFVFEDVAEQGYKMPDQIKFMSFEEITAVIEVIAKFAAKTIIFEENKSKELGKQYRVWDEYSNILPEPDNCLSWRDAGRKAVVYFLNLYSQYREKPGFEKEMEAVVIEKFQKALDLMNNGSKYRSTVCHRDLWTNNILFKRLGNGKLHALIVDFQTVIYSSPLLDLAFFLYFNTNKEFRNQHTQKILKFFYDVFTQELVRNDVDVNTVLKEKDLQDAYEESRVYGIVQAAILVPIATLSPKYTQKYFTNPETIDRVNNICRNDVFLEAANEDKQFKRRMMEFFDEIVERYVYPEK